MISFQKANVSLSAAAVRFRVALLAAIVVSASVLRTLDPMSAHIWLPLSCGAVTGVPCIFCGTTRALHYLLNGDFSRALYFNWIAFPVAAMAVIGAAISLCEVMTRRQIVRFASIRVTPRAIGMALATVVVVWTLQVWLAVSQHKTELLNPRGPLYALLVRSGS